MKAVRAAWPLARRVLHALDPERAHDLTLKTLAHLPLPAPAPAPDDPRLAVDAFGLKFANPVGLAAGFDKDGVIAHRAAALGFGFTEVGTLTPRPQAGNPRPRLFRLPEAQGVVNRFGFNNLGHEEALRRLRPASPARLGINIGANKDASDRVADYVAGIRAFAAVADYFTINISSPNTPGLRDLQKAEALDELLARVLEARDSARGGAGTPPVLLKIAPDLTPGELDAIVAVARRRRIDGMIVSNTTISRPPAIAALLHAGETGGLSGQPLFDLSTRLLAQTFVRVEGQFPLVGVGGIDSPDAAWGKIEAGATLLQLYSALVYKGPALVEDIKRGLLRKVGNGAVTAAVGCRASDLAGAG